jgi:hypothetical protein
MRLPPTLGRAWLENSTSSDDGLVDAARSRFLLSVTVLKLNDFQRGAGCPNMEKVRCRFPPLRHPASSKKLPATLTRF